MNKYNVYWRGKLKLDAKVEVTFNKKEWLYGGCIIQNDEYLIFDNHKSKHMLPVDADTLCRFIGLYNNKKIMIFEGDILQTECDGNTIIGVVEFDADTASFILNDFERKLRFGVNIFADKCEYKGNVVENADLVNTLKIRKICKVINAQHLVKGKRKDNNEWCYGYLHIIDANVYKIYICSNDLTSADESYEVIPESVCMCSCLKDNTDTYIFSGDIIKFTHPYADKLHYAVYFNINKAMWNLQGFFCRAFDTPSFAFSEGTEYMQVVGNMYDNADLLNVDTDR